MAKIKCPHCQQLSKLTANQQCEHCQQSLREKIAAAPTEHPEININFDNVYQAADVEKTPVTPTPFEAETINPAAKSIPKSATPKANRPAADIAGWLVIHDERKATASYDIFLGDNFFGTAGEGFEVDIPILNDRYVSRSHANIRVSKDFLHRFHYQLLDDGTRRPKGPSLNGTYVNGNEKRLPKDAQVFLRDGDTIQVGDTKLVFKTIDKSHNLEEAANEVLQSDYTSTVILRP